MRLVFFFIIFFFFVHNSRVSHLRTPKNSNQLSYKALDFMFLLWAFPYLIILLICFLRLFVNCQQHVFVILIWACVACNKIFSIKLAGSTAIVIIYFVHYHYFDYVISYKFYLILHLFSDNTSIIIHRLLHLLSLLCDLSFGRLSLLPNLLFIFLC